MQMHRTHGRKQSGGKLYRVSVAALRGTLGIAGRLKGYGAMISTSQIKLS
jgi:hypothetical protein